jgi:hypothetical protein
MSSFRKLSRQLDFTTIQNKKTGLKPVFYLINSIIFPMHGVKYPIIYPLHRAKYPIIYPLHRAKYPIIYPFCQDFFRRTLQKKCFDIYFGLSIMDNLLQILTFDANKILHRGRKSSTTCPDTSGKLHGGLAYSPCLCGSP